MLTTKLFAPAVLAAVILTSGQALAAGAPTGVWMNDTGRGAIEIKPCGGGLCGHVVWVKDESDAGGCGRQIIGDAVPAGANTWDNGWIYSPERKKKYDVELTPIDDNRLRVKGYAGTKLFSKTMTWTRAPADLVRCGTEEAKANVPGKQAAAEPQTKTMIKAAAIDEIKPQSKTAPIAPQAAPKNAKAPATEPASPVKPAGKQQVAENDTDEGGLDVSELSDKFGDVLTRSADGKCKLDLPWVKLNFECDGK